MGRHNYQNTNTIEPCRFEFSGEMKTSSIDLERELEIAARYSK